MGRALAPGPRSAGLWELIASHRSALEYDWRTRFGLSVSAILTRDISWREAWDLTSEILRDPDSHTCASLAGWAYVPGPVERAAADLAELWVNAQRRKNTTPWRAPRPWLRTPVERVTSKPSPVDVEQRARLDALLGLVDEGAPASD